MSAVFHTHKSAKRTTLLNTPTKLLNAPSKISQKPLVNYIPFQFCRCQVLNFTRIRAAPRVVDILNCYTTTRAPRINLHSPCNNNRGNSDSVCAPISTWSTGALGSIHKFQIQAQIMLLSFSPPLQNLYKHALQRSRLFWSFHIKNKTV